MTDETEDTPREGEIIDTNLPETPGDNPKSFDFDGYKKINDERLSSIEKGISDITSIIQSMARGGKVVGTNISTNPIDRDKEVSNKLLNIIKEGRM